MGITTTSDERGYYKLVVPYKMVKRSEITVNDAKSEILSKKYGKDVIAIKVNSLGATNEN